MPLGVGRWPGGICPFTRHHHRSAYLRARYRAPAPEFVGVVTILSVARTSVSAGMPGPCGWGPHRRVPQRGRRRYGSACSASDAANAMIASPVSRNVVHSSIGTAPSAR